MNVSIALNSGGTLTGVLYTEVPRTAEVAYNVELSSINPLLAGGGYAKATVSSTGKVQIKGLLPDGNSFTASTSRTDNSAIAFYAVVGRGVTPTGLVGGYLTIANNTQTDISGELVWSKPAQDVGRATGTELGGVDTTLTVNGSIHDPRVPIYSGYATVVLAGGNLLATQTNTRLITSGVVPVPTGSIQSWRTNVNDGTFTFTAAVPTLTRFAQGSGVYLQKSNRAVGYFPGTTSGGRVVLIPSAP